MYALQISLELVAIDKIVAALSPGGPGPTFDWKFTIEQNSTFLFYSIALSLTQMQADY